MLPLPGRRLLVPLALSSLLLLGLWGPRGPESLFSLSAKDAPDGLRGTTAATATPTPPPPLRRHALQPPYPHPYRFLINQPHKCRERTPFLVLLVVTEPRDVEGRRVIRQTWGNESSVPGVTVVRLFLVGLHPVFGKELQALLEEENALHGDLLQQDFLDTYHNLTLKTLMGMEWVAKHCPNASYVVKADRDVFLNVAFLAERLLVPLKKNFMTGYIYRRSQPIRHKGYKWYVPAEVYPNATYPPYCGGPAYVLSGDLAAKIYGVAQTLRVINMEDAFMGICLHALGVGIANSPWGAFNMHRVPYEACRFDRLVMVHHYQPAEMLRLWPRFQEEKRKCRH